MKHFKEYKVVNSFFRHFLYLESHEERDSLDTVVTSVNIVTHEEIVGVWRLASDPEQLHQIMELTVNISAHCHWTLDCLNIALLGQDLLRLLTQDLNLGST